MKRAFASDFDGTLYFMADNPPVHEEDVQAVRAFQEQGGLFGICTGRPLLGITEQLRGKYFSFDFYLVDSGTRLLDKDLNVLEETLVDQALVRSFYEHFAPKAEFFSFHAQDTLLSFHPQYEIIRRIEKLDDLGETVCGFSFRCRTLQEAAALAGEANALFPELTAFQNILDVDVAPRGCSKGNAVRRIRELLHLDETAGIGDSYNDLPLLDAADVSFTFDRAPQDLQRQADHVVHSTAEAIRLFQERK